MAEQLNGSWQIDNLFNLIHICQIIYLINTLSWSSTSYRVDQISFHKYIIRLIQVKFKSVQHFYLLLNKLWLSVYTSKMLK